MLKKTLNQTLALRAAGPTQTSIATSTGRGVPRARLFVFISIAVAMIFTSVVSAKHFSDWGVPVNAESIPGTSSELNTTSNEGYPIQSPDGLSLYIVSDRPGGIPGGLDIWVAQRASTDDTWGAPENLGLPVNSSAHETSPAPVPGHGLFFVSARAGGCGSDDIYFTRFKDGVWEEPQNLGCQINSTAGEAGPSYFEDESGHAVLYFSSNRAGGLGFQDIYYSVDFSPAQLDLGLSTTANDVRPYVRKDGREIVFDSNRPGSFGLQDIYTASRETTADDWSTPTNLGPLINSTAMEARATLSRDGFTMFFGSNRGGGDGLSDIFITTRKKLTGNSQ
jgi:Tol biopolymer transport system component